MCQGVCEGVWILGAQLQVALGSSTQQRHDPRTSIHIQIMSLSMLQSLQHAQLWWPCTCHGACYTFPSLQSSLRLPQFELQYMSSASPGACAVNIVTRQQLSLLQARNSLPGGPDARPVCPDLIILPIGGSLKISWMGLQSTNVFVAVMMEVLNV